MSYRGPAHQVLNRTLAGIAKHPNIGGYLLIGLRLVAQMLPKVNDVPTRVDSGERDRDAAELLRDANGL